MSSTQIGLRLGPDDLARVDRVAATLSAAAVGVAVSRIDVIRLAIRRLARDVPMADQESR